jgi:hypothetical protein
MPPVTHRARLIIVALLALSGLRCGDSQEEARATGGSAATGGGGDGGAGLGGAGGAGLGEGGTVGGGGSGGQGGATETVVFDGQLGGPSLEPGVEIIGRCASWTLDNDAELWVTRAELDQDAALKSSDWFHVPSDVYDGPDGFWPCSERSFDGASAIAAGGVVFSQSNAAASETQAFASGAAFRIAPRARIIAAMHFLNDTPSAVAGNIQLRLSAIAPQDVQTKLVPFSLRYTGLAIPPMATSRFTATCDLDAVFSQAASQPFGVTLFHLMALGNGLGTHAFVDVDGGARDGERVFDSTLAPSLSTASASDPPRQVNGATGLRFGCEYANPRTTSVGWGFGDQERCDFLGFADSLLTFACEAETATHGGLDGNVQLFASSAGASGAVWDHDKPGGPSP